MTTSSPKTFTQLLLSMRQLLIDVRVPFVRGMALACIVLIIGNLPEMIRQHAMGLAPYKDLAIIDVQAANRVFVQQNSWYMPAAIISLFLLFVANILYSTYVYCLLARRERSEKKLFMQGIQLIVPFIMVLVWRTIYSYIWIGLVIVIAGLLLVVNKQLIAGSIVVGCGLILALALAIIRSPRLSLAFVIRVQEKVSSFQAVRLSLMRTQGYWGKIVGNLFLLMLIVVIPSFLFGILAGIISIFTIDYIVLAAPIFIEVIFIPVVIAFIVVLSDTIKKHARHHGE